MATQLKAEVIALAVGMVLVSLAVKKAGSVAGAVGDWIAGGWKAVTDAAGAAVDAVYDPESAVSGTLSPYSAVDFKSTANKDITSLIVYFQQNGNSTATRNQARSQGWTLDEIATAVATMGSMNGEY